MSGARGTVRSFGHRVTQTKGTHERQGGRRSLRHVLFQAGVAAACHNLVLKAVARRMKERGKPHKLVIIAIALRLVSIANAVLKTGLPWRMSPTILNTVGKGKTVTTASVSFGNAYGCCPALKNVSRPD